MRANQRPLLCPQCHSDSSAPGLSPQFCWHCGQSLLFPQSRLRTSIRLLPPLLAFVGSLMAWVRVASEPSSRSGWNVYHFGAGGWAWLAGDLLALLIVVWTLAGRDHQPRWVWTAWKIFGGLSLGMGLSGFVSVKMAGSVSSLLSVPSPLHQASGVLVFVIAGLGWVLLSFLPD